MSTGPSATSVRRIAGLDTVRALAIALAMTSHGFHHFGVWLLLEDSAFPFVKLFTRSATPMFIILFGMMLEIVYLKMLRHRGRHACWQRLLNRAIQCYLLYLCVVVAGVIGGKLDPGEGVGAALFLSNAYFANILKFYSLGLVAGILLVELRARFGLRAAGVALLLTWLCYPVIKAIPPPPESVSHLASFLIGAGAETGPSILQGMSFATLGLFLGNAVVRLRAPGKPDRQAARRLLAVLGVLGATAIAVLFVLVGVRPALAGFVDFSYRAANHPGYYIIGSAVAIVLGIGCMMVAARLPGPVLARLNVFGINSLFAYAIGNVVLNLLPPVRGSLALGLALTLAFLVCLYGATAYFRLTVQAQASDGPSNPLAARIGRLHAVLPVLTERLAEVVASRLLPRSPAAGRPTDSSRLSRE